MSKARVQHLPVLKEAKLALLEFAEEITATMATVDAEIARVSQWLSQERPAHWKGEVRRREDAVTRARAEIERKRLIAAPEPASVALEQRTLERAKARLQEAQKRLEATKRWGPVWDRQALMYKGSCHGLSESVHVDVPRAAARIERMLQSLEAYVQLRTPEGDPGASPGVGAMEGETGEAETSADDHSETRNPESKAPPEAGP